MVAEEGPTTDRAQGGTLKYSPTLWQTLNLKSMGRDNKSTEGTRLAHSFLEFGGQCTLPICNLAE